MAALSCAAGLVLAAAGPHHALAAEERRFLSGPEESSANLVFAPRLAKALSADFDIEITPVSGSEETLDAVFEDSSLAGFTQFDAFRRYVKQNPDAVRNLEFYGDVPVCLLAVTHASVPTNGLLTEEAAFRNMVIDVGAPEADVSMTARTLWPDLDAKEQITLNTRGGYRGMASVAQRLADAALFMEYPSPSMPTVRYVLENAKLQFADRIDNVLGPLTLPDETAYIPTHVSLSQQEWFSDKVETRTLCTSLGVVINAEGGDRYTSAIVRAVTIGALLKDESDGSSDLLLGFGRKALDSASSVLHRVWSIF